MSEKSEVVTVCSWQFAGEERLRTAPIDRLCDPLGFACFPHATQGVSSGRSMQELVLVRRIANQRNNAIQGGPFR